MDTLPSSWADRLWQDFQPTPGRWNAALRVVLASTLTLLLLMTLRMPFSGLGMYYVFLISRDSPAVSLRSSLLILCTVSVTIGVVLMVVVVTGNDPVARVLSVAMVTFVAGMLMQASTLSGLASTLGFIFCTLIALWETQVPADSLVKEMLYLVGTIALAVGSVIAVEYVFGSRNPAEELQQERCTRYQALERMFTLYAEGADAAQISPAVIRVSRLAATGQSGMQRLYNIIVERNLDPGTLPIGARVRVTMLAQLVDIAAAFGWQNPTVTDPALRERCAHIAALCRQLPYDNISPELRAELTAEHPIGPDPSLLDRIDGVLHSILSMPMEAGAADKKLVALPSSQVPFFLPGAISQPQTIAFALKISLCATLCYIIYWALAWPGISTAVTTVLITGLSTSAATKQRLIFRLAGSLVGGLILAIGSTIFLYPYMDSITSLVILSGGVALLSAWVAGGRYFGYVGLQIAFSYYLVVFAGFAAPRELAPARDRFIGILIALVIMAFVFDQIWPVRTVTAMRAALATLLRGCANFLRLPQVAPRHDDLLRRADSIRDQIGKTMANVRTMNETIAYEFGVDRHQHSLAGETMVRAGLTLVAFFWNHFAVMHSERDRDFLTEPALVHLHLAVADSMDRMANALRNRSDFPVIDSRSLVSESTLSHPRYAEHVKNSLARFDELQNLIAQLRTEP